MALPQPDQLIHKQLNRNNLYLIKIRLEDSQKQLQEMDPMKISELLKYMQISGQLTKTKIFNFEQIQHIMQQQYRYMTSNTIKFTQSRTQQTQPIQQKPKQQPRAVLWNVIQPGDPYDIRRSRIASIPTTHNNNNNMKDNIQLVCLLQSAQIQRLNQYLQQYKQHYFQLQRKQLDRHSYQIQIKQLSAQLQITSNYKQQNYKLQAYIKKLSEELESLKNRVEISNINDGNYQNALLKMQALIQQNNRLEQRNRSLQSDVSGFQNQMIVLGNVRMKQKNDYMATIQEQYRLSNSNIQNNNNNINNNNRTQFQALTRKYKSQLNSLTSQNNRLNQSLSLKNTQLNNLLTNLQYYQQQQQYQKQSSIKQATSQQIQQKIVLLATQIQRITYILNAKNQKYYALISSNNLLIQNYADIQKEYKKLRDDHQRLRYLVSNYQEQSNNKINDEIITMDSLHEKLLQSGEQIDRLNSILKSNNISKNKLQNNYNTLILQINKMPLLQKQNIELKQKHIINNQNNQITKKKYQNKLTILSTELQRSNSINLTKQNNLRNQNQQLRQQNAKLQIHINQITNQLNKQYLQQINNMKLNYQNIIREIQYNYGVRYQKQRKQTQNKYQKVIGQLINQIDPDSQKKVNILAQELERLNKLILQIKQQNNKLLIENRQLQPLINQINSKNKQLQSYQILNKDLDHRLRQILKQRRTIQYKLNNSKQIQATKQKDLQYLLKQNNSLKKQLGILNDYEKKIHQDQNQIFSLIYQNNKLKELIDQIDLLQKRISHLQRDNIQLYTNQNNYRLENQGKYHKIQRQVSLKYVDQINMLRKQNNSENKKVNCLLEQLDRLTENIIKMRQQRDRLLLSLQNKNNNKNKLISQTIITNKNMNMQQNTLENTLTNKQQIQQQQQNIDDNIQLINQQHYTYKIFSVNPQAEQQQNNLKNNLKNNQKNKNKSKKQQLLQKQQQIYQLKTKNNQLNTQMQALEKIIQTVNQQNIQLKQNIVQNNIQLQQKITQQNQQNKNRLYQSQQYNIKLQQQYNRTRNQYQKLRSKSNQSDIMVQKLSGEFSRLQVVIEKLKKQRSEIIEKNINFGRLYDRLLASNNKLQQNIKQLRLQIADKITLEKRLEEQLGLMVVLFAQIQSLRNRIDITQQENKGFMEKQVDPYRI